MAKQKLKLVANPTFKAKVGIPMAGGDPVQVEFTFKHRTKSALDEFVKSRSLERPAKSFLDLVLTWEQDGTLKPESAEVLKAALADFIKANPAASDAVAFLEMVVGWDLEDEFNAENVELLLQNYAGAAIATYRTYIEQLLQARLGN